MAREVNRRLGLGEDSTVGKSVAAAASVGAMIPMTEIGAQAKTEGRSVDQQRLQSAYDYARKAVETSQLTDAAALVKEFRTSDAYQWARGSRIASTSGFDSSYREATDRQSSSESAYGRARELARTAQFMREWSSGAQTDFTNYAARRLAERGLLREEDPIKLQRAVTEIAYAYARGGNVAVLDIRNITKPELVFDYSIEPQFKGPHTSMPFFGVKTPNFTPGFGDVRDYIVVCNEASDAQYRGQEVRCMVYMLDVTVWKNPMMADIFRVPDADFLARGGRFGPHQFNETRDNKLYRPQDNRNLLYVAYFAGGLRVLDLSDPYDMKEVGYYVPKETSTTIPRLKTVVQTNDVDLDHRGLAYISDRAGTGLHVVEYLG